MTIGRNGPVTIDDFVYRDGGGRQGVSLAKGVMRVVGGGVSRSSGAQLRTPTASIGVHGGMEMVRVSSSGTLVADQYGVTKVGEQTLTQAGYGVYASSNGQVSGSFLVPKAIAELIALQKTAWRCRAGADKRGANLLLGNQRPTDVISPPGLNALNPIWAGNALAQSRSNVESAQPAAPPGEKPSPAPEPVTLPSGPPPSQDPPSPDGDGRGNSRESHSGTSRTMGVIQTKDENLPNAVKMRQWLGQSSLARP